MRSRKALVGAAVLALLAGIAWFADRQLKHREHPGLITFIKQVARNYPASFQVEPVQLVLNVKDEDLAEKLKQLVAAKDRFRALVKAFNETVQFNNTLNAISSTALDDSQH